MTALLDTNVLVRYLTGDPPQMFETARRIIEGKDALILTDVVLAKTAYVLAGNYGVPRADIVDGLTELVQKQNVEVFALDKGDVLQGLSLCRPSGRVSFADAFVWAAARASGANAVYSFDQRFPEDSVQVLRHAP